MANLKEVRTRISSVKSTQQITSAMKLVSASKLRRAQTAIQSLRPYASKMQEIMGNLSDTMETMDVAIYSEKRPIEKVLLVVVTSNKGLCGPFNANIIKAAIKQMNETFAEQNRKGNVDLYCVGKKGSEYFTKRDYKVYKSDLEIFNNLTFEASADIAKELAGLFADKKYDHIEIIYNQFKNAAVQILQKEQYLPIEVVAENKDEEKKVQQDYIFEPNKEEIILELLPKTLRTQFFKAMLDSFASEHGARMTAMQLATDNANEIVRDLQLAYNKARQAAITNELIEIVSGAEALKG